MTKTHFGPRTYLIVGKHCKSKKTKMFRVYAYDANAAKNLARTVGYVVKSIKRVR